MKKIFNTLLIVAMMFLLVSVESNSQETEAKKTKSKVYRQAITTDPIDLLNSERFNIKYEQNVGKKNSFTVDLMYNYAYNTSDFTNIGITIGGAYRWYFHNLAPEIRTKGIEGLSAGPFINLNYVRWHINDDNTRNDIIFDVGGEVAYKFVVFEGLAIEPTIRLGMNFSSEGHYNTGFQLWPGVSIGYTW